MLRLVLLTCIFLLVYVYVLYPVICVALGKALRRGVRGAAITPRITIITSARNEEACIAKGIANKLQLDYSTDSFEVIVVSDGSTDGTDAAIQRAADMDGRVRYLRQEPRAGKTAALNAAAAVAKGEILVFADANSLYAPDALRKLAEPFADPAVGYVTGKMVYLAPDGSMTGEACSLYMRYENFLRRHESAIGSIVGVNGGIDAIRASLYLRMRPDQQPDLVLPLSVVQRGARVVFVPGAIVFEESLSNPTDEFGMRIRVTLRAWHVLLDRLGLLNPLRYPLFAWQLWSHKWLRYFAPVFQMGALVGNVGMLGEGLVWDLLFAGQCLFYLVAALGVVWKSVPAPLSFPYYLCLLNGAAAVALARLLLGHKQVTWSPRR
jgi:cellulose synthase/poly-beta-1,6-N-acetylglucosamine synthase-like glycosyltransferase